MNDVNIYRTQDPTRSQGLDLFNTELTLKDNVVVHPQNQTEPDQVVVQDSHPHYKAPPTLIETTTDSVKSPSIYDSVDHNTNASQITSTAYGGGVKKVKKRRRTKKRVATGVDLVLSPAEPIRYENKLLRS